MGVRDWILAGVFAHVLVAAPPDFRLGPEVVPLKHAVELTVDPNQSTFDGWMRIEVDVQQATSSIWINAKDLIIRDAQIEADGQIIAPKVLTASGEFIGLETSRAIGPGPARISVRYQGRLDERSVTGAWRRKVGGDWYAYTTFTPIEARRAFPCFDEPRFKTPWEIALRVRREHRAFSNGAEIDEKDEGNGWKLVRFATTPPLPAEVVAFAVGPFDVLDGGRAGASTPVRVITEKGRAQEGTAAAQATALVLPRLEAYTGIPYAFGKLDHLSIPDGEFSAVENPGLIIYRSKALLASPETEISRAKPLRSLQAHEIGHQWFGNLVTQADWRDVWLSEGFATWIEYKMMDMEQPADRAHLTAIAARERIMRADTSIRTRPVRALVETRENASAIYNRFVYDKGASILMMVEAWLGPAKFQQGVRDYLNRHRFGTATLDDLAAALKSAAGTDPSHVLAAFLDNGGTPSVQGSVECEEGDTLPVPATLRITQTGSQAAPVCWRADTGASGCEVLEAGPRAVKLTSCPTWVYLNNGGTGYYRTTWTSEHLAQLRLNELVPAERLTLVYDLRAQKSSRGAARTALEKLAKDTEPEIAAAARDALK